ncbi:unnamed protein product [Caenorhabditis brenneri]
MPIFTTLEARIQKKLRESTSAAKVSNDEISLTMELLLAKIASHSVTNSSENAESVRFSHFMCFLKAAILSSKMKGLENLLKKIDSKIKEPISMDKVRFIDDASIGKLIFFSEYSSGESGDCSSFDSKSHWILNFLLILLLLSLPVLLSHRKMLFCC